MVKVGFSGSVDKMTLQRSKGKLGNCKYGPTCDLIRADEEDHHKLSDRHSLPIHLLHSLAPVATLPMEQ